MRQTWSIATKELRGYFNSAVALIFLATFLIVVMFTFFTADKFFARNVADVRPLFDWLPLLLIFLVAALTMRLWSEEHKTGTIEILMTLPVPIHRLVVGKFLAGLALIAIALALTLGLPITVSMIGDLDWGPVIGGYLAALMLASMYLALGLCVSSATDNQIVALILTVLLCTLLYLPGADTVAGLFSVDVGAILRQIGTGSRFESVARGVLDLRDLAYYAGWVVLLLGLNALILEMRKWSTGRHTARVRQQRVLSIVLIGANAVALNLWLSPVTAARVDLTADGLYRLSSPTVKLLNSLDEPLRIHGYFSGEDMPDLLKPHVPRIRDLLAEYKIEGEGKVQLAFMDPGKDEDLAEEIEEQYSIRSQPFRFSDRSGRGIRNAYFYVLVAYGDQHEVLGIDQLIDVEMGADNAPEIKLKNIEYQVTKAVRKVAYGFQSLEALFASLPQQVELELYVTPDTLPPELKQIPATIEKVANEVVAKSSGKLAFRQVTPTTDDERQELYAKYNIQPLPMSLFLNTYVYLDLAMRMGDRVIRIGLSETVDDKSVRNGIDQALELVVPGFIKVVGLVVPQAPPPQQIHPSMPPQRMPAPQSFEMLRQQLEQAYEVRTVNLDGGTIDDDIDVLLLAGPADLDDKAQRAIDQHLMRGRSVIALAGKHRLDRRSPTLGVEAVTTGLDRLFEAYGVELGAGVVMDTENIKFPAPSGSQNGPLSDEPRPYFVKVIAGGRRAGGMITSWLGDVVAHWSTSVKAEKPEGSDREVVEFLRSSSKSWVESNAAQAALAGPSPTRPSELPDGVAGPHALGVALRGSFDSAFRDASKDPLKLEQDGDAAAPPTGDDRLLQRSPPNTRLAVVGSSAFASDLMVGTGQQLGIPEVENNLKLVLSLVDWAVADEALLEIRASSGRVRTIEIDDDETAKWEIINYVLALMALVFVVALAWFRRRAMLVSLEQIAVGHGAVRISNTKAGADERTEAEGDKK